MLSADRKDLRTIWKALPAGSIWIVREEVHGVDLDGNLIASFSKSRRPGEEWNEENPCAEEWEEEWEEEWAKMEEFLAVEQEETGEGRAVLN